MFRNTECACLRRTHMPAVATMAGNYAMHEYLCVLRVGVLILARVLGKNAMTTVPSTSATTTYHWADVDGVGIFYREAGPKDAPTIVLLHGYSSSSRMFDSLIPLLASHYHLIAPDYRGSATARRRGPTATPIYSIIWP